MVKLLIASAACLLAGPVSACGLALLLALDISSSVDAREDRLQREGLAQALRDPDVTAAIVDNAPMALGVFQWSGRAQQDAVLNWQMMRSPSDVDAAADRIAGSLRSNSDHPTGVGYAVAYARAQFATGPACAARVLDVSGDGLNNDGYSPALQHAQLAAEGIGVNGLVVKGATANDADVIAFYEREVRFGPGAFVEVANGYHDYARAMRRKLLRELTQLHLSQVTR